MTAPFQVAASIVTGSASSRSYPVQNATAAGDTLTAIAICNNTTCTVSALTDGAGNIYTLDKSYTAASPMIYAFRSPGATGGPSGGPTAALTTLDDFQLTTAAVSGNIQLYVIDVGQVGALDQVTSIATGTGTTPSVSATPANNNETAITMWGTANAGGSPTVNSPFTGLGSFSTGSNPYGTGAYDVLSGGSGTPLTSTLTITSAAWRGLMWLFQAGSGGITGTGALALSPLAFAAAGAVGVSGSGGLALSPLAFAAIGSFTPPPITGAGGLSLSPLAFAGGASTSRQLILSIAPAAGTDPYGNAYPEGISVGAAGSQQIQLLLAGLAASLTAPSGESFEQRIPTHLAIAVLGAVGTQLLNAQLLGPALAASPDRVEIDLNSAIQGGSEDAQLLLIYNDTSGGGHQYVLMDSAGFTIAAGSIVATHPGSSPAVAETWQTLSLQNSFTAGTNNGSSDPPQVRMMADNKTLMFKGNLVTPATGTVTGVTFASLPSGYPGAGFGGPYGRAALTNMLGGSGGHLEVHGNGNLQLSGNFGNSSSIDLTCLVPTQ